MQTLDTEVAFPDALKLDAACFMDPTCVPDCCTYRLYAVHCMRQHVGTHSLTYTVFIRLVGSAMVRHHREDKWCAFPSACAGRDGPQRHTAWRVDAALRSGHSSTRCPRAGAGAGAERNGPAFEKERDEEEKEKEETVMACRNV
jgi:hypothetical protein